jgi:hypothetical protein
MTAAAKATAKPAAKQPVTKKAAAGTNKRK